MASKGRCAVSLLPEGLGWTVSYQRQAIFSDLLDRIPPKWEYDVSALAALSVSNFRTEVVGKNNYAGSIIPIEIRFLITYDLDELLKLHGKVIKALPKKEIFRADERTFLESHIERRGRTVGAFYKDRMIGYAVVSFPKNDNDNLGCFINLDSDNMMRVAHFDGACVDPDFRGSHLHRIMNQVRGKYAILAGYYHLMGTVSPLNPYSLMNHLGAGFRVVNFAKRYGGLDRLIIYRDGRNETAQVPKESFLIALDDREAIKAELKKGYIGLDVVKMNGTYKIVLGK